MSRRRRTARRAASGTAQRSPEPAATPEVVEPPAEWFPAPDFRAEVLASLTVVQLRQAAIESGVSLRGAKTKAAIIAALMA